MNHNPLPLSICMIVRDEESTLPLCLRSVMDTGVAREVIVVDTGSRDRTPQIAREAGATVLSIPWADDFSAARNVALSAATSEWILSLDADEELEAESIPLLTRALRRPEPAQIVQIQLLYQPGQPGLPGAQAVPVLKALRLFRNDPRIRFRGRVHENVVESVLALDAGDWPDSGVRVRHHGYVDRTERKRKGLRNLRLLEAAHRDHPDDLYMMYKLALTLPDADGERRRGLLVQAAQKALILSEEDLHSYSFLPQLFCRLFGEFQRVGELTAAGRLCSLAAERLGRSVWFTAGKALAYDGEHEKADEALLRYLETEGHVGHRLLLSDPEASMTRAWYLLGWTALKRGRYADAKRWLDQALVATPGNGHTRDDHVVIACDRVRIYLGTGQLHAAVPDLSRLSQLAQEAGASRARREVMLVSAEVSVLAGDLPGALPLAQAAMDRESRDSTDDRGAALCASLLLRLGPGRRREAKDLLPLLRGARYDTLAVRLLLEELSGGQAPAFTGEVSDATLYALDALRKGLPKDPSLT